MIVVQVEGNIGSGKSTFLKYLKDQIHSRNEDINIKIIDEPLSDWMNINNNNSNNNNNIFNLYYKNPKKYAESFQTFAFLTMLNNSLKQNYKDIDILIMERSVYSSVHCFVKLLLDEKYITPIFYEIMKKSLKLYKDKIIYPTTIVYLKTNDNDIDILTERIKNRGREAEKKIEKKYLRNLNNKYDKFIERFDKWIKDDDEDDDDDYFRGVKMFVIPINKSKTEQESIITVVLNYLTTYYLELQYKRA